MGGGIGRGGRLCGVPTVLSASDFPLTLIGFIVNASGWSEENLQNMKHIPHEKHV